MLHDGHMPSSFAVYVNSSTGKIFFYVLSVTQLQNKSIMQVKQLKFIT